MVPSWSVMMRCSAYRPATGSSRGHAATSRRVMPMTFVEVLVDERAGVARLLRLAHAGVLGAVHAQHRASAPSSRSKSIRNSRERRCVVPWWVTKMLASGPASTVNRRWSACTRKTGPSERGIAWRVARRHAAATRADERPPRVRPSRSARPTRRRPPMLPVERRGLPHGRIPTRRRGCLRRRAPAIGLRKAVAAGRSPGRRWMQRPRGGC